MLNAIGEANPQYFTSLNLEKAFWQVPLNKSSKQKAAILIQNEIYNFKLCHLAYQEHLQLFNP